MINLFYSLYYEILFETANKLEKKNFVFRIAINYH